MALRGGRVGIGHLQGAEDVTDLAAAETDGRVPQCGRDPFNLDL